MAHEMVVAGIGTAVPVYQISQADAASTAGAIAAATASEHRKLAVLYRSTGVRTRGSVLLDSSTNGTPAGQSFYAPQLSAEDGGPTTAQRLARYEESAPELAIEACRAALVNAGVDAAAITHLVTVSCSGFSAPGVDLRLIQALGLSPQVSRTHVGFMGCHGALNGLRVARGFTGADPQAVVLLCAVELCSLHHQYGWHPERVVANALFADGAAAIVGMATDATRLDARRLIANGSCIIPETEDLMSWRIGNHGFEMTLSAQVPEVIQRHLRGWLSAWLTEYGLTIDAVASWAIHPGGPRILTAVADAAGFDRSLLAVSQEVLAECGNMSSPTVLFILSRLWERGAPTPCVTLAFGPGLAIEAALFA